MNVTESVLAGGVALMAPLLWAALGELISEKAGVMNLGIEGVMALAALGAASAFQATGDPAVALAAAVGCGLACAVVLGGLYIWLSAAQIVAGIVFGGVAVGLSAVLAERYLAGGRVDSLDDVALPGLSRLPVLGPVLFDHNVLVYGAVVAVPLVHHLLHRTWFGLHVRVAGERPLVDESAGVSVRGIRALAITLGCVFTAVGGATLVLSTSGTFTVGMTAGRGYIALSVVVLARWNAFAATAAAVLFGAAQAFQFEVDRIPLLADVPRDVVLMIPYGIAVLVVLSTTSTRYPAAVGEPYHPRSARRSRRAPSIADVT